MKTVLVLSFSDLGRDPRVYRQIKALSEYYRVITAGYGDPELDSIDFIPITRMKKDLPSMVSALRLLFQRYEAWYWSQRHVVDGLKKLSHIPADLILANNIDALPLALKIGKGVKVILDAHEYAPRHVEEAYWWRIFFQDYQMYLCKTYIPRTDGMITVCQGIADAYQRDTGIKPIVITSAPEFEDITPGLTQGNEETIRLVHHGAASPPRKIENMIEMMDYLDERFELNLILLDSIPGYLKQLRRAAEGKSNIHFWPPVPMRSISRHLSRYDIGICLFEPVNFNLLYCLPNKFFEFIQARLAIAVGPSPEMARIVKNQDLGVVAEDFSPDTLARCLKSLNREKINYYKLQSHRVSRILSAEQNKKILLDLVQQALGDQL
jgi:hypothetical protein